MPPWLPFACGAAAISLLAIMLGCAGAPARRVPTDASVQRELDRLRAPYQVKRTVVADRIEVTMSANFFNTEWGEPSIDRALHEASHRSVERREERTWVNRSGGTQLPLRFAVGDCTLVALHSASLRVLGNGEPIALAVLATGAVSVLTGAERRDGAELSIDDGTLRLR